jgi:hypothetical protein
MTIQGSIEVFPPAVFLRFLATTQRTGQFVVTTSRGTGTALLRHGRIGTAAFGRPDSTGVLPRAAAGSDLVQSLAQLLAVGEGRFTFTPLAINGAGEGHNTFSLVDRAEALARQPVSQEELAVSRDARVVLSADVTFRHLRVDDTDWSVIVAVGDGNTVAAIAEKVGLPAGAVGDRLLALAAHGVVVLPGSDTELSTVA